MHHAWRAAIPKKAYDFPATNGEVGTVRAWSDIFS
jgi:hypothetical protein